MEFVFEEEEELKIKWIEEEEELTEENTFPFFKFMKEEIIKITKENIENNHCFSQFLNEITRMLDSLFIYLCKNEIEEFNIEEKKIIKETYLFLQNLYDFKREELLYSKNELNNKTSTNSLSKSITNNTNNKEYINIFWSILCRFWILLFNNEFDKISSEKTSDDFNFIHFTKYGNVSTSDRTIYKYSLKNLIDICAEFICHCSYMRWNKEFVEFLNCIYYRYCYLLCFGFDLKKDCDCPKFLRRDVKTNVISFSESFIDEYENIFYHLLKISKTFEDVFNSIIVINESVRSESIEESDWIDWMKKELTEEGKISFVASEFEEKYMNFYVLPGELEMFKKKIKFVSTNAHSIISRRFGNKEYNKILKYVDDRGLEAILNDLQDKIKKQEIKIRLNEGEEEGEDKSNFTSIITEKMPIFMEGEKEYNYITYLCLKYSFLNIQSNILIIEKYFLFYEMNEIEINKVMSIEEGGIEESPIPYCIEIGNVFFIYLNKEITHVFYNFVNAIQCWLQLFYTGGRDNIKKIPTSLLYLFDLEEQKEEERKIEENEEFLKKNKEFINFVFIS